MLSPLVSSASGELKSLADGSPQSSAGPTDVTASPGTPWAQQMFTTAGHSLAECCCRPSIGQWYGTEDTFASEAMLLTIAGPSCAHRIQLFFVPQTHVPSHALLTEAATNDCVVHCGDNSFRLTLAGGMGVGRDLESPQGSVAVSGQGTNGAASIRSNSGGSAGGAGQAEVGASDPATAELAATGRAHPRSKQGPPADTAI